MASRVLFAACACAAVCFGAGSADANTQSNRWFYMITNEGRDVHFTIQLIEEDPPNFDTTFKLTRDDEVLFEHRQFVRDEADEVVGPGACIEDWLWADEFIDDCDGDGTDDCAGICGTAYRYEYVDECVPSSSVSYRLYDEATLDSVGFYHYEFQPGYDPCLDSDDSGEPGDSGCSVAVVTGGATDGSLATMMLLVGLGFAMASRRRP